MDFQEFYTSEIAFYKDVLERNIRLYDQRGQELHDIDLSFNSLSEKYEELLEKRSTIAGLNYSNYNLSSVTQPFHNASAIDNENVEENLKVNEEKIDRVLPYAQVSEIESSSKNKDKDYESSLDSDEEEPSKIVKDVHHPNDLKNLDQTFPMSADEHQTVKGDFDADVTQEHHKLLNEVHRGMTINIKLKDEDIEDLLEALRTNTTFEGAINLSGHSLTDQSLLKLSSILEQEKPVITSISLNGNSLIGTEGIKIFGETISRCKTIKSIDLGGLENHLPGASRIIESLAVNSSIEECNLGRLTGDSLQYLGTFLKCLNNLRYLTIEESSSDPWTVSIKEEFITALEHARASPLLALNVYSDKMDELENFIGSLALIFETRRRIFLLGEESDQQDQALEVETFEVETLHRSELVNSFSTKKYIDNIFLNKLEESLVLIEKHRRNIIRAKDKEDTTGHKDDPVWSESDLFTADGSCYALALFLFNKYQAENQS